MTAAASRKKKVQQEKRHDSQKELENSRALNQNLNTLKQEIKRTSHTLGRLNRKCYFVDKDINYWHRNINIQKGDQAGFQHKPRMIQDNGTQSGLWSLKRLLALLVGSADTEYCRRLCLVSSLLQQKKITGVAINVNDVRLYFKTPEESLPEVKNCLKNIGPMTGCKLRSYNYSPCEKPKQADPLKWKQNYNHLY